MSGHSKWHNIQKTKGAQDAKRAQAFTKIAREMIVAVKEGGSGDPANNSRLAAVVVKAKAANMPNDNIKRTIDKALGSGNTDNYESGRFEGYGAGGVAVIVEVLTDNKNRTSASMSHAFDKFGGNLGVPGCVGYMFDRKGVFVFDNEEGEISEDTMMEAALEAGADDVVTYEDSYEVYCDPNAFDEVAAAFKEAGYEPVESDVMQVPNITSTPTDEAAIKNLKKMVALLEDDDDVQHVYTNCTIDLYDEE